MMQILSAGHMGTIKAKLCLATNTIDGDKKEHQLQTEMLALYNVREHLGAAPLLHFCRPTLTSHIVDTWNTNPPRSSWTVKDLE